MPDGERRQRQYHDFFNYAGLHRSVWLYSTPTTYIADLTVVTELDSHTGLVRSEVSVDGHEELAVRMELRDADDLLVAEIEERDAVLTVPNAQLWEPGRGYLYRLQVDLVGNRLCSRRSLLDPCRDPHGGCRRHQFLD